MKIVQMVNDYYFGDAVGNDVTAIHQALCEAGYETAVYSDHVGPRVDASIVRPLRELEELTSEDVVLMHFAIDTDFVYVFAEAPYRKVLVYHNVTPSVMFGRYNTPAATHCCNAVRMVKFLADKVDWAICMSEFSKRDLCSYGYTCPIDVIPILIPFEDYGREPDYEVLERNKDVPGANIMFLGRVAPNKCFEDVVSAFASYKSNYDPMARLFLVGSYDENDIYYRTLVEWTARLGVEDVVFTGKISFPAILAYYRLADVLLCQSEHEGFCVPLAEAMFFDIPIVAYGCSAIPDTLGGSGVVLNKKNPELTAQVLDYILSHEDVRQAIIEGQRSRLEDFSYENVSQKLLTSLEVFLGLGSCEESQ